MNYYSYDMAAPTEKRNCLNKNMKKANKYEMPVCSVVLRRNLGKTTRADSGGKTCVGLWPIKRQFKIPEKHLTFIYCVETFVMVNRISSDPCLKKGRKITTAELNCDFSGDHFPD